MDELHAETPDAYADLWRFCFDVDLIRNIVARHRRPNEPLLHLMAEPGHLGLKVKDGLWVRLVDVPAAVAARRYAAEGTLVFELGDDFCPWNEGRYELAGGPDGAECRPTEAEPDVELRAEDLGAAYLGGVSFRDLARAGRVTAAPEALARADAMFEWDPAPWCPFMF